MDTLHATPVPAANARPDLDLVDILIAIAKRKKQILLFALAVTVLTGLVGMALPKTYRAGIKILPPQQAQSGAAALLAQLGGVAGAAAGAAGVKNPNDLYIGMLKSRTLADRLIERFDLKRVYGLEAMDRTRKELANNSVIGSSKDGLITVEVDDGERARAAKLANAYAEELLRLTKTIAVTEASQRRLFFERQLEQSKDNLARAEAALKGALDTRGVISVDSDSRAIVETVARLRAQIAAKEVQLNSMRAFVTANNQDYKRASEELQSLRAELDRLQNGRQGGPAAAAAGPNGLENIKLLRDVKYHQMLYELLSKQYEVARLDEAKDSSIIQVLDPAVEPERKHRPLPALMALTALFVSLFFGCLWAFLCELRERAAQDPARAAQFQQLRRFLRFR